MRVSSFAVAFFMADVVVEAGVCKPARTTTAESLVTSSVESSTALPATSTESVEISLTESLVSTTETASSEVIETVISSTALVETTSTELLSTVATAETSIATTTTDADVTTTGEASTTTEEASTTTTEAGPSATPGSIVGTGPVAGQTVKGNGSRFVPLSFASSDSTQTLIFSLVSNGQLSTGNNNNYLCLNYKDAGALGPLVLCPFDNFQNAPLTCTRASTGALSCSAPNGSCTQAGTCRRPNNGTPFSQFYVDSSGAGYFGPAGDFAGFTALDLTLAG